MFVEHSKYNFMIFILQIIGGGRGDYNEPQSDLVIAQQNYNLRASKKINGHDFLFFTINSLKYTNKSFS